MWWSWFSGLAAVLLLAGCTDPGPTPPPPTTAAYHWQTRLHSTETLRTRVRALNLDRLYVKVFDVVWDGQRPQPTALLEVSDTTGLPPLVPVVFLTNEVFTHDIPTLATDVVRLIRDRFPSDFAEVQFDCDWTARTRVQYFGFLQQVRQALPDKRISCTVRLHQFRDRTAQGIPPVDRGVLMAYNTGNLDNWATENSIVDTVIARNYVVGQPPYPLPLDFAVAVYDWVAVYRRNRFTYLINEPNLVELADTSRFEPLGEGRYRARRGTYFGGLYLYEDDWLRHEVADTVLARRTLDLLKREVRPEAGRIVYYRIGSRMWEDR